MVKFDALARRQSQSMTTTASGCSDVRVLDPGAAAAGCRLDQFLAQADLGLTRSRLRQLISGGNVLVNGAAAKPAHRLRSGDLVSVSVPAPRPSGVVAQDIPIAVVYQDADLIVIDKPPGLSVHPGPGHPPVRPGGLRGDPRPR